ncbi:hypothetical protein IE53DRAFT_262454 [Violaceomyces palustris]|uniref:Uncharacterized protein n=1 Tax=Violaceomyces palustris TaxID=1673888 RepID=A0ACD0NN14_9BASI|nr:hypothetical protein IE53DRAFT_262454 [Violaceomyces palustris]
MEYIHTVRKSATPHHPSTVGEREREKPSTPSSIASPSSLMGADPPPVKGPCFAVPIVGLRMRQGERGRKETSWEKKEPSLGGRVQRGGKRRGHRPVSPRRQGRHGIQLGVRKSKKEKREKRQSKLEASGERVGKEDGFHTWNVSPPPLLFHLASLVQA